jgi:hypothetical protein
VVTGAGSEGIADLMLELEFEGGSMVAMLEESLSNHDDRGRHGC